MDAFPEVTPLWDLSQSVDINQLPDNDFLALLQKQFPTDNSGYNFMAPFTDGINPQSITPFELPSLTPPSEDSSPSPPNSNQDGGGNDDVPETALKRKASDEDFSDDGPTTKSQHTGNDKKSSSGNSRRKSTGGNGNNKDEGRLMKRKEQNRAAQRAFRERKEKHVKDLEDKVADLEAKNEQALHENENLRDLLTRLQTENVALKQSSFTFTMPKAASTNGDSSNTPQSTFSSISSPQSAASPLAGSSKNTNPIDWSSLTTFDPAVLNLLDDSVPQPTATEGAMQMDFGFGATSGTGLASNAPYTSIASNPMFMSFASTFDNPASPTPSASGTTTNFNQMNMNFDMNNLSTWSTPSNSQDTILDDLFSGYLSSTGQMDMSLLGQSPASSLSPVAHHVSPPNANSTSSSNNNTLNNARSPVASSSSSSSSPSVLGTSSLVFTPRDSPASSASTPASDTNKTSSLPIHSEDTCPRTRKELEKRIASEGASPFAPPVNVRKSSDSVLGTMIACSGSSFPTTAKSDKNIEVLSAWRSIRADPKFKDADINALCSEFTSKARCDGTKVVLEPQGVHSILENLSKKQ
ncbi:AP-1-like transcription factor yap1 [Psilocybe cubensis]|uniref:BZIP domain-containing protein n=2 Tax=Psilocybe cubensis TaxID=181762 RepID=A0A8H7Y687_PSICU|nr:AP-1-like transcription factor yap1 [Psilocybe cubensis]KAH9487173.1 AP-1-like transcription factor yap1 [Psilocybe cubensis]